MERKEQLLRHIDLRHGPGVEIGPLDKPIVAVSEASMLYVDHASTEELRAKYHDDPHVSIDEIVPIDVRWADRRLSESLEGRGPVRWVVASHVIEHVPDPAGWLGQIAEVLVPGGILSLAIPDGRFCFDAKRRTTDVSELIAAALSARTRPTVSSTYDFWARMTAVDPVEAWEGRRSALEPDHEALALEKCHQAITSSEYQDIHCSVFTPQSFVEAFDVLMRLDIVPWYLVRDLRPTERGQIEFFVSLERLPAALEPDERRHLQSASVASALASVAAADMPGPSAREGSRMRVTELSEKELTMVELKRSVLSGARRMSRRLSRRL